MTTLTLAVSRQLIPEPLAHIDAYELKVKQGPYFYREVHRSASSALTDRAFIMSTLIAGGHVAKRARSFLTRAADFDLSTIPSVPLQRCNDEQCEAIAAGIREVAAWDGFGTSTASKLLHVVRPHTVPVLDRESIGGAYLCADWAPGIRRWNAVGGAQLTDVLGTFASDLKFRANRPAWRLLEEDTEGHYTRLQLLDMVWWSHYKGLHRRGQPRPYA